MVFSTSFSCSMCGKSLVYNAHLDIPISARMAAASTGSDGRMSICCFIQIIVTESLFSRGALAKPICINSVSTSRQYSVRRFWVCCSGTGLSTFHKGLRQSSPVTFTVTPGFRKMVIDILGQPSPRKERLLSVNSSTGRV